MEKKPHQDLVRDILKKTGYREDDLLDDKTVVRGNTQPQEHHRNLVLKLHNQKRNLPLTMQPVLIGREPYCTIQIPSMTVSRAHAIIYKFGKNFMIRDLHSTNGLMLNGIYKFQAEIRPGDQLQIGEETIEVLEGDRLLDGYLDDCSVLFLDIEGYTSLCEQYGKSFSTEAQSVIERLQDQLLLLHGCPIKNLGDGLMGAFGLWLDSNGLPATAKALDFARYAVRTICKHSELPALNVRIGIAQGETTVLSGNTLDLYGDNVNLASRLEMANKIYGTTLLMNEQFIRQLDVKAPVREIDRVRVKGKQIPTRIYTFEDKDINCSDRGKLLTTIGNRNGAAIVKNISKVIASGEDENYRTLYQKGLELYQRGRFLEAFDYFERGAALGDPPSVCMHDRVQSLLDSGYSQDWLSQWDGVWDLEKS